MKTKFIGALATAMLALAAFGSAGASAATEIGNSCAGEEVFPEVTFASLASSSMPATVQSAGVITSWALNNSSTVPPGILSQSLKVFRPTGTPTQYQVVGESAASPISTGINRFDTRIPVQAGDFVGASGTYEGTVYTFYCVTGNPADRFAYFLGSPPPGTTVNSLTESEGAAAPVTARVEPDADGDGFGDETQDGCPQSGALQSPCPVVSLSLSSIVKKGFARILVTTNTEAPVKVVGTVKLGKGKKVKLSGGKQIVVPGTISKFTVIFPGSLKSKLQELSRKQSLSLAFKATATNAAGALTTSRLKAKIRGQKKPARKGKGGKAPSKG